jgi:thiamine-phosphate pyrophosphorylase
MTPAPEGVFGAAPRAIAPRLIAVTDRSVATAEETLRRFERVARAARPFSVMFQLRDRELSVRERLAFGHELRALCTAERQWFQVNDRCDLAVLLAADALHLGETSVSAADARHVAGAQLFVSRACHDPERHLEAGVDAWVLSPIFVERKGRGALGVAGIVRLCARIRGDLQNGGSAAAVFALGGVTALNASTCLDAGAAGVAALGAILSDKDPERLFDALLETGRL